MEIVEKRIIIKKKKNPVQRSSKVKEPQVAKLAVPSRQNSIQLMDEMIRVHLIVMVSCLCFFFSPSAGKVLQRYFAAHQGRKSPLKVQT